MNSLAEVYHIQTSLNKAEELYRQTLKLWEKNDLINHMGYGDTINGLAGV